MIDRFIFADELDSVSDRIEHVSSADVQIILRRAALWIRNTEGIMLDHEVDEAITALAADLGTMKLDLLRRVVREWLETGGYLPVRMLEEDGEVDGSA